MSKLSSTFLVGVWMLSILLAFNFTRADDSDEDSDTFKGKLGSFCGRNEDCQSATCLFSKCTDVDPSDGSKKGEKGLTKQPKSKNNATPKTGKPKKARTTGKGSPKTTEKPAPATKSKAKIKVFVTSSSRSGKLRNISKQLELIKARTSTTTVEPDGEEEGWAMDYPSATVSPAGSSKSPLANYRKLSNKRPTSPRSNPTKSPPKSSRLKPTTKQLVPTKASRPASGPANALLADEVEESWVPDNPAGTTANPKLTTKNRKRTAKISLKAGSAPTKKAASQSTKKSDSSSRYKRTTPVVHYLKGNPKVVDKNTSKDTSTSASVPNDDEEESWVPGATSETQLKSPGKMRNVSTKYRKSAQQRRPVAVAKHITPILKRKPTFAPQQTHQENSHAVPSYEMPYGRANRMLPDMPFPPNPWMAGNNFLFGMLN